MLTTFDGGSRFCRGGAERRFSCIFARDSRATELLHGCPVVSAAGDKLGSVQSILIDTRTRQIRYVMVAARPEDASVAVPWHALYFDAALGRLVFYTYS
jgi:hypothetical protein